jgi:hypothetical protein
MHFYWRVIEELKFLGETWIFNDPSLRRSYEIWIQRNADAIALSSANDPVEVSTFFDYKDTTLSLN